MSDSKTRERWLPLIDALEAGVWLIWITEKEVVYVPTPIVRANGGTPSCDHAPSMESLDLQLWFIDGIEVDEQIVMRPDTQSVKQIDGEANADIRSIRIARFGWPRYLKESGAKAIDESKNYVTGCPEALYEASNGSRRLVVVCPTGRMFAMGVPPHINTCEQAQRWLAPHEGNCLLAT